LKDTKFISILKLFLTFKHLIKDLDNMLIQNSMIKRNLSINKQFIKKILIHFGQTLSVDISVGNVENFIKSSAIYVSTLF
jgi:hypothetical protein